MESHGSIKVYLRVRGNRDSKHSSYDYLALQNNHQLLYYKSTRFLNSQTNVRLNQSHEDNQLYTLDQIFNQDYNNYQVYQQTAKLMIAGFLQGQNSNVMLYGQTASGKTFTMIGSNELKKSQQNEFSKFSIDGVHSFIKNHQFNNIGILVYTLLDIFKEINRSTCDLKYIIQVSYFEIYNDSVYDLLRPQDHLKENLQVQEDSKTKEFRIKGLLRHQVVSMEEVFALLIHGGRNRHFSATILNHVSSRSHALFIVELLSFDGLSANPCISSTMTFIDLAGCEKIDNQVDTKSDQINKQNKTLGKECQAINKSLFCLSRLLHLKSQKLHTHLPYRDSLLTKIIKYMLYSKPRPTFDQTSQVQVILFIKPEDEFIEQNLQTLAFGLSSQQIHTQNVKRKLECLQNVESSNQEYQNKDVKIILDRLKIIMKDQPRKFLSNEKDYQHLDSVGLIPFPKIKDQLIQQSLNLTELIFDYEGRFLLQRVKQLSDQNAIIANSLQQQVNNNKLLRDELATHQKRVQIQSAKIQEQQIHIEQLEKQCNIEDTVDQTSKVYQSSTSIGINFTSLINELSNNFQVDQGQDFPQQFEDNCLRDLNKVEIKLNDVIQNKCYRQKTKQAFQQVLKTSQKLKTNETNQSYFCSQKKPTINNDQTIYRPSASRINSQRRLDQFLRSPLQHMSNKYQYSKIPRSLSFQTNRGGCTNIESLKYSSAIKDPRQKKIINSKSISQFNLQNYHDENEEQIQIINITPQMKHQHD